MNGLLAFNRASKTAPFTVVESLLYWDSKISRGTVHLYIVTHNRKARVLAVVVRFRRDGWISRIYRAR